jgi:hypothetical protein
MTTIPVTTQLDWIRQPGSSHYRARDHRNDYVIIGGGEDPAHAWLAIPSDPRQPWRTESTLAAAMTVCAGWSSESAERLYSDGAA